MGDPYFLSIDCGHCGKLNAPQDDMWGGVYFSPSSRLFDFKCVSCGKLNYIRQTLGFSVIPVESGEEAERLFKEDFPEYA